MQNEGSAGDDEGIEPVLTAWGDDFKRHIRAAAALVGIYDDTSLAAAVHVQRNSVAGWWHGAKPAPETLARLAQATGIDLALLTQWVYFGGPPPFP